MANRTMDIALRTTGGDAAVKIFHDLAAAALKSGADLHALLSTLGQVQTQANQAGHAGSTAVGQIGAAAAQSQGQVNSLTQSLNNLNTATQNTGQNAGANVGSVGSAAQQSGHQVDALKEKFEKLRDIGASLKEFGGNLLGKTNEAIEGSVEGSGIEQRLESLLKAQGRSGDLDTINEAIGSVTEKAHLPDDDPARESVIQMASDQVATPDIAPLLEAAARNAETLGSSIDQVGAASAKAYAEGNVSRLQRMNILFSDQEAEAVKAAYAINETAGRAKFMQVVLDSTARSTGELGTGLSNLQAATNDADRAFDDFQANFGAGAGNAEIHIQNLKADMLEFLNTMPGLESGSGFILQFGSYAATAAGGVLGFVSQIGMASIALKAMGITGVASFQAMAASAWSAAAGTVAAMAPVLATLAAIVAVALLAAAAIYAIDKVLFGGKDAEMAENIEKGKVADQANFDDTNARRKKQGKAEISAEEWNLMQDPDADVNTPEQAKALLAKKQAGKIVGGGGGGSDAPLDVDAMQKQLADAMNLKGAASVPTGAVPNLTVNMAGAAGGFQIGGAAEGGASSGGDVDAIQGQIDALRDQLRHLKGKEHEAARSQIQDQIAALQHQLRGAKATERNATKAQKEADKLEDVAASDALAIQKAQMANATDARVTALQDQLEAAQENKNAAAVRALTLQIEKEKAGEKYHEAMAAAAREENAAHRAALEQIAGINFQGDLSRAEHAADKASRSALKGKGDGDEANKRRDAELRARLAMQQATAPSFGNTAFSGLGSGRMSAPDDFGGREGGALTAAEQRGFSPVEQGGGPSTAGLSNDDWWGRTQTPVPMFAFQMKEAERRANARPVAAESGTAGFGGEPQPVRIQNQFVGKSPNGKNLRFAFDPIDLPIDVLRIVCGAPGTLRNTLGGW